MKLRASGDCPPAYVSRHGHHHDRFGNAITNISRDDLASWAKAPCARRMNRVGRARLGEPLDVLGTRPDRLAGDRLALPGCSREERAPGSDIRIKLAGRKEPLPLVPFYQSVPEGQPLGILGSAESLEIAINGGSAAKELRLQIGDQVTVRFPERTVCGAGSW